ncbi:MAG: copper oxidase [Herbaspirillum huttiense]|uniref:multicopper oxidase family protein n=1 Tax=Herbaspirillum huttiense TaxID=863372 RepID=UPI001ACBA12C|nr:copper oxidase [Herbaspirillum huttiense]MBN9358066.1 copper oxidase [Herbaspirillum huttiense]
MNPNDKARRHFLQGAALAVTAGAVSRAGAAGLPEAPLQTSAATQPPLQPATGRPYQPVVTLNGWTLPWRMKNGVKEFHLIAEAVEREIAPGMKARLWGYNGQSPGPTIEVVEGDKVRIFVTNKLPEATSVHWHGQRLPNGMDGVSGLTQAAIPPGKTYVYEFTAKRAGTFMYHPHADEMVQMAMGMMGFWVTHPRDPGVMRVDRDFVFLMNAYDIAPGASVPKVSTMLDFNLWTWNSRAFPGIDPLVVRQNDRVRIRVGNLTMTNHPLHLHGHEFSVTGTDGGWVPPAAHWPEVTTDIAVGQMRAIEFDATEEGDWALHCHKAHHTMNAMGHDLPTMIGVDQSKVVSKISRLIPDYMAMGDKGGSMGEMEMPLPDNTLPMMTGRGPYGPIEMGGMFSTVKVRRNLARDDYRDPGWYRAPAGTVAREWQGEMPEARRAAPSGTAAPATLEVIKPGGHQGHH